MLFDLYELVHSLSKAEKRYFRRSASLHVIGEKNNYLRLFELIEAQKKFDEASISSPFKEKNFYLLKRHLQLSLLRSLRSFHAATSISMQVHTMIDEVEVLYKKGLIKAALKLAHHAKKIAFRHEQQPLLLQLLEWEIKLSATRQKLVQEQGRISRAFEEAGSQIDLYKNFMDAFHFRMNVSAIHNKEIVSRRADEEEELKKLSEEIKRLSKKALSKKAQWELYNGAGTFYSTIGDYVQSNSYHKKAALISEKNNSPASDELRQYLLSFYSQSISYYYLNKFEQALENLKAMQSIFSSLPDLTNKTNIRDLYLHAMLLEGFILIDTGLYEKAEAVITELGKKMEEFPSITVSLRNDIYYQQTCFWFYMGEFKQSQVFLSKMLQDEDAPKENPGRYRFARIMQLMLLFAMHEFEQIENLLPATKKFMHKKGQQYKIEDTIITFISAYIKGQTSGGKNFRIKKFTELKKKLTRLAKGKNEAAAIQMFNYIQWAESGIQNKTFSELAKEKK